MNSGSCSRNGASLCGMCDIELYKHDCLKKPFKHG